ncbi:glycosyltransferase family 4 protein [Candidatus Gottesmanbacteria bacterium]|nr:glycosyltransferase family 4 protein [Candidatus Gottesmanbacteria bacterium]
MKIALLAPFEESVPPKKYGGTELVIYNLITEFVSRGHDVTLFGVGDSQVPCKVEALFPHELRTIPPYNTDLKSRETAKFHGISMMLSRLQTMDFDMVHNHAGWRLLLFHQFIHQPLVTTLHGPTTFVHEKMAYVSDPNLNFVSISDNQRQGLPDLHYIATVYNGLDMDTFDYNEKPEDYFVFLARFSPQKGAKEAIDVAKKAGIQLKMACKIDVSDQAYYNSVKDAIDGEQIQLLGEMDHVQKVTLLKNAKGMLAPIQWEEPFGLFVVEAMACGTPVFGMRRGSFPELIEDEKNGFLADTVEEMAQQVKDIDTLSRSYCRQSVEAKFTKQIMASKYLEVYQEILKER